LRLAAPLAFGNEHLAPALAAFALRHPRLALDVSYADRVHDIIGEGFDAALRIGLLGDSSLLARRIAPIQAVLAASPAYLGRCGAPGKPQDLAAHEVLIYAGSRDPGLWMFDAKPRPVGVRVQGRMRADSGEALRAAALAGLGIGVFPAFMVYRQLQAGALVVVLQNHLLPVMGLHLVRPPGPASAKLTMLTDFLVDHFGSEQPWDMACRLEGRSS
jgi:DNA-binding transcriptional LysR family regulator